MCISKHCVYISEHHFSLVRIILCILESNTEYVSEQTLRVQCALHSRGSLHELESNAMGTIEPY